MRIQDFNPVIKEDTKLSDIATAHALLGNAIRNPSARQEYFDYMIYLRSKHGKEYSISVHQQATEFANSVKQKSIDEDAWTGDNPAWHNGNNQWNDGTDQWHSAGEVAAPAAGGPPAASTIAANAADTLTGELPIEEDVNPQDVVKVDIPLLLRLLEYAREDAKTDMDLHYVTERLIALSQNGNTLTMQDYNNICNTKETD
jgi:hypothetical protein